MDKGIIIGVEVEAATRTSLSFAMFRHVTSVSVCPPLSGLTHLLTISTSRISFCITSFSPTFKTHKGKKLSPSLHTTSTWSTSPMLSKSCSIL